MKKKKKTKAPVNTAKETQERYRAYIKSIKLLFEKMVGPGYFEMLSPKLLALLPTPRAEKAIGQALLVLSKNACSPYHRASRFLF